MMISPCCQCLFSMKVAVLLGPSSDILIDNLIQLLHDDSTEVFDLSHTICHLRERFRSKNWRLHQTWLEGSTPMLQYKQKNCDNIVFVVGIVAPFLPQGHYWDFILCYSWYLDLFVGFCSFKKFPYFFLPWSTLLCDQHIQVSQYRCVIYNNQVKSRQLQE